jgi:hypothetical protein
VNLRPQNAQFSYALSASGGKQVGYAHVNGKYRASLWSGSAASWVDLHPDGADKSQALDVFGSRQVGFVMYGNRVNAALWMGTKGSFVNLQQYLSGTYTESRANAIYQDIQFTYIVGSAFNYDTERNEAVMWVQPRSRASRR